MFFVCIKLLGLLTLIYEEEEQEELLWIRVYFMRIEGSWLFSECESAARLFLNSCHGNRYKIRCYFRFLCVHIFVSGPIGSLHSVTILFCKHYFSPLNTFMRKRKGPELDPKPQADPELDSDP